HGAERPQCVRDASIDSRIAVEAGNKEKGSHRAPWRSVSCSTDSAKTRCLPALRQSYKDIFISQHRRTGAALSARGSSMNTHSPQSEARAALTAAARRRILVLDGAMGTMIQQLRLDEAGYR